MAINVDAPISAANLKAVVEKLMGGGVSPGDACSCQQTS